MEFIDIIRRSMYGPEYYRSLAGKPLSYSIKYFLGLAALLAVIASVVLLIAAIPAINAFLGTTSAGIVQYYPDNLQITIASGSASTNVPEPYFLALPQGFKSDLASSSYEGLSSSTSTPNNLLVIDTKDPVTVSEFQGDNTLILLASDSLVYAKDGAMVVQPLGPDTSFTINKTSVTSFMARVEPYFKWIDWLVGILMPIGIFIALLLRLVYLLVLALLIWGLARASGVDVGYKKSYQWGIHLMTLPLIVSIGVWLILPGFDIPFLFTVLALIMAALNLRPAPLSIMPPPAL